MDSILSLLLVAAAFTATLAADPTPAPKINVSIYFESLCSESKKFIVEQFTKAYNTKGVKDFIQPDYVPYGHVNVTDCQHGPKECEGNKILGCAIHKINGTGDLVAFVNCIMALKVDDQKPHFPLDDCKKEAGPAFDDIAKCWNSAEGESINKEYGNQTNKTFGNSTFGVPNVIINNLRDDALSKNFTSDFLTTLCSRLPSNTTLGACKSSASALLASFIPAILAVFIARL